MKWIIPALMTVGALVATPALANLELAKKHNCMSCHAAATKVVGPAYADVAKKYAGDKNAVKMLAAKVKAGSPGGVFGPVPMPPNANVPDADVEKLVKWILAGAK